jgi:hypothetical protein
MLFPASNTKSLVFGLAFNAERTTWVPAGVGGRSTGLPLVHDPSRATRSTAGEALPRRPRTDLINTSTVSAFFINFLHQESENPAVSKSKRSHSPDGSRTSPSTPQQAPCPPGTCAVTASSRRRRDGFATSASEIRRAEANAAARARGILDRMKGGEHTTTPPPPMRPSPPTIKEERRPGSERTLPTTFDRPQRRRAWRTRSRHPAAKA